MSGKYILKAAPSFYKDLNDIISYIGLQLKNPIAAKNLVYEIEKAINIRLQNPAIYEKYKWGEKDIYYKINVRNYSIFYIVKDNNMILGRIIYSRRNFNDLL